MEDLAGFICLGVPILFIMMIKLLDALADIQENPRQNFASAGRWPPKKKIMYDDSERKKESCPICDGPTKYRMSVHGREERYLFFCNQCKLHFEYSYCNRHGDFRKHILVDASCPECNRDHKPAVIGDIDTDQIPCEACWDKAQVKPEPKPTTWRERKRRSWNPWMV